jgi:hypothetical protein
MHQTSVSAYLTGKVPMHDAVRQALEVFVTRLEANSLGTTGTATIPIPILGNAPVSAAPAAPKIPSFARTFASIPVDGAAEKKDGVEPVAAAPSGPQLVEFPVDRGYQLAEMVRTSQKSGEITATFSLRKMLMWARATYLLQSAGFDYEDAIAGGFHLAAEGKSYGEERTFLRNSYQAVFNRECKLPRVKKRGDTKHPAYHLIKVIVEQSLPLWLYGPTGSGKTHTALEVLSDIGRPGLRIQGTGDMTVDDLLGGFGAKNGSTQFEYGPLPQAMMQGAGLIIDEITACPAEVLFELQAVLEGNPLVIKKNRGEVIQPQPGFTIIACDNTIGLGEASEYVGTNVMNEAFRDRFLFAEFDYMPADLEKAAVKLQLGNFLTERKWLASAKA